MPGQDGLGRDQERRPSRLGNQTGEEGDKCSIRPGEARTGNLTAEHGELVAKDEDLGVLGHRVHSVYPDDLDHPPGQPVEQGQPHGGRDWPTRSWLVKPCILLLDPSRHPRHKFP